ncbi:hypothetical protein BKP42_41600 [Rhodococcus erythropolis]|uniref:hypothetical protein n=1 Tax=Rhodococcus erythropolis TaxID=1833 RepID=UPI000BB359B4|nr:hypothetical protein [Rhodococcus erythropolis]PBI96477.1 hypothetical protein BKP42_41600 [Rhodococcus erythropolis]
MAEIDYADMDRRKALIYGMPGAKMAEHFESLNRASRVFSGNALALARQVGLFTGTDAFIDNLGEDYGHETDRLFHNFLASVGSLRDIQRAVHRKIWPAPPGKNTHSQWELSVYTPRAKDLFGTTESTFIQDLRNYNVHYDLPAVSGSTNISWKQGGPVVQSNALRLNKSKLLRYKNWSSNSKKYLANQGEWVDFLPALEVYTKSVQEFYGWFWASAKDELDPEFSDFDYSFTEFGLWQSEDLRWRDWRMSLHPTNGVDDPPAVAKAIYANAKLDRWAHGSRSWRIFQCAVDGQPKQIGDDPWGLPPRSP